MKPELLPTVPEPIAPDTWLIPSLAADPAGGFIGAHSAVIRGTEPVVLDTSVLFGRDQWLQNTFSVVEPEDVRWIFLSHDDHDHLGNLDPVLDLCPNATLLANYAMVGRLFGDVELPLERMRWINVGESIDVGDRELVMVRPPMFDSPATRGLFDTSTGMLWAADSFGTAFPGAVYDADDIPAEVYDPSFEMLNLLNTPWMEWVDPERFAAHLATTESLPLSLVASAHGPVHRGSRIADAFRRTRDLAGRAPAEQPGQDVLELLCAMLATTHGLRRDGWERSRATQPSTWSSTHLPPRCGRSSAIRAAPASGATSAPRSTFVDGTPAPRVGARFRGRNRVGRTGWTRTCEIVGLEPGHEISWRTIPTGIYQDSTIWTITVEPEGVEGSRITQRYQVVKLGPVMDRLIYRFVPVHRDRREALTADLQRIGEVARDRARGPAG